MTMTIENTVAARPQAAMVPKSFNIADLPEPSLVYAEAMQLFPTSMHQRMMHYTRHCTYRNQALGRNPSMSVADFIGAHGEGKTAIAADYVLKCAGVNPAIDGPEIVNATLANHLTVVSGGGLTDFADITGLQYIDKDTKTTMLARQAGFGQKNAAAWRLVLIDDWTRALPHMMQGLMQLINTGRHNTFALDMGSFIVCTRNPEGDDYNVSGIDPAQYSRTIPLVYNVSEKIFFEQLQAQKIDPDIINFWMKHPELAKPRQVKIEAVKEANCSRFKVLFSEIYEYIKYDQAVLNEVATSMFGPQFLSVMMADRRAQQPIPPHEIINNWGPAIEKKVEEYAKGHQDVLTVTAQRLAYHMNDKEVKLTNPELANVVRFMAALPKDSAFALSKLLIDQGQPKADDYSVRIAALAKQFPDDQNIVKQVVALRQSINSKLKQAGV